MMKFDPDHLTPAARRLFHAELRAASLNLSPDAALRYAGQVFTALHALDAGDLPAARAALADLPRPDLLGNVLTDLKAIRALPADFTAKHSTDELLARLAPAPLAPELPADLGVGFAAEDDPEPDATHDAQPGPIVPFNHPDLTALHSALSTLSPSRSYAAHHRPNWERERGEHLAAAIGHALGAVAGRVLILGSRGLGRHLSDHTRRTLAHALHGAAHTVHPHADGGQG